MSGMSVLCSDDLPHEIPPCILEGVAKAFYTVHHAVNPDVTKKYLERLQAAKELC